MATFESRETVGLRPALARPRIPGPVYGVSLHYNGDPMGLIGQPHDRCRSTWRGVQALHMDGRGWVDIAYTMASCWHGILMAGRGAGVRTAANGTREGNDHWYAIFLMVGGDEVPTHAMKRAVLDGVAMLGESRINRHSDHKPTLCPGKPTSAWVVAGCPRPVDDTTPEPPEEDIVSKLPLIDLSGVTNNGATWKRGADIKTLQGLLVARGVAPASTIRADGSLDGVAGPGTRAAVRTFQNRNGLVVDGKVGTSTWAKLLRVNR